MGSDLLSPGGRRVIVGAEIFLTTGTGIGGFFWHELASICFFLIASWIFFNISCLSGLGIGGLIGGPVTVFLSGTLKTWLP